MSSTTSISFILLWIFTTTITIDGISHVNKLSSKENYLDFHTNKIRIKRQLHNWTNKDPTSIGLIAKNERSSITNMSGPPSTKKNLEEVAALTQLNVEITQVRESNRIFNIEMAEVRTKNTNLEAMNVQLQKQYTDILRELERRELDFSREVAQLRQDISLLEGKLSLNREIMAYRELIDGDASRSDP